MSDIRTLSHPELGDYLHVQDLVRYLLTDRDAFEARDEAVTAAAYDRLIVEISTPFMLRDNVAPTGEAAPLHTEPEQGDADK